MGHSGIQKKMHLNGRDLIFHTLHRPWRPPSTWLNSLSVKVWAPHLFLFPGWIANSCQIVSVMCKYYYCFLSLQPGRAFTDLSQRRGRAKHWFTTTVLFTLGTRVALSRSIFSDACLQRAFHNLLLIGCPNHVTRGCLQIFKPGLLLHLLLSPFVESATKQSVNWKLDRIIQAAWCSGGLKEM